MKTLVVKRLEQAKLLTDPFKLKLLERFGCEPVTTKQVADAMHAVPYFIGDRDQWIGQDAEVPREAQALLRPNATLSRTYQRPGSLRLRRIKPSASLSVWIASRWWWPPSSCGSKPS